METWVYGNGNMGEQSQLIYIVGRFELKVKFCDNRSVVVQGYTSHPSLNSPLSHPHTHVARKQGKPGLGSLV